MCLCGMLAAEHQTLPGLMRDAVVDFLDLNEVWLARVLELGRSEGTLQFDGSAGQRPRIIVGSLEGAMLVARPYHDASRFEAAASHLLGELLSGAPIVGTSG